MKDDFIKDLVHDAGKLTKDHWYNSDYSTISCSILGGTHHLPVLER